MEINYTQARIVAMSDEQVKNLSMLCPKLVYCQIETSGSPSCWTTNGENLVGTKGSDVVECAQRIRRMHDLDEEYNKHSHGDNRRAMYSHIRLVF